MSKKEKQASLKQPIRCPKCGSKNISADCIETDGEREAWSNIECQDCMAIWKMTLILLQP
jgi:transcription elongation factor Elf1